jgi:predicted MFS family arabinose efflux permease
MVRLFSLYKNAFSNLQRNTWVLAIAMFINRSGSMVLLFTSLYLTRDLNFSIGDAGFIMSFYGFGSVLGSYAGGWLTDRFNYYTIMMFSLLACGSILLLMLIAHSMVFIIAIIFFYGLTSDMFRPANTVAINAYSTPENRTRSVSLIRLAINLGFSLGPAIGGVIAVQLGYKWLFIIDSFTTFCAAAMLYFYLPKKNAEKLITRQETASANSLSAYKNFFFLSFIILVALYGTCFFQLFASVPQYFSQVCKYPEDTIGLLLALNGLLVVLIEMPLIFTLEKSKKIFSFIIAGTLCLPVAFTILSFGEGMIIWAIVYTFVITMSEIFAMPFMMNYVLAKSPKERQGQYSALYSISFGISIIAAPLLGLGIAAEFGFHNMFLFFIVLSIIVAAGFAILNRKSSTPASGTN